MTEWICSQLDTWGAYHREEQLCLEVLTWLPERSIKAASLFQQLGNLAYRLGAYDQAVGWYKRSLPIFEELSDRKNTAGLYHDLGVVAQVRGAYGEALDWYKRSLPIFEELGNRTGMASSYHQLGMLAQQRGAYDEALDWFKRSLQIEEELGNRAGMAGSYSQLGVFATAQGRPEEGLPLNLRSLAIRLELGVPEVKHNLHWLRRQRELLGEERFGELLREHVGDEGAETVLGLMAQVAAEGGAAT